MLRCKAELIGMTPLGYSAFIRSKRGLDEPHDAFEERTWKERLHSNGDGVAIIPPMNLKNCMRDVAQHLGERVKGKGMATYSKHFKSGIMVTDNMTVCDRNWKPVPVDAVEKFSHMVPSDGKTGGGKRVLKHFPMIREWQTRCEFFVIDPVIIAVPAKVEAYLRHAGKFIGIGFFRPARSGNWGMWDVKKFEYAEVE